MVVFERIELVNVLKYRLMIEIISVPFMTFKVFFSEKDVQK